MEPVFHRAMQRRIQPFAQEVKFAINPRVDVVLATVSKIYVPVVLLVARLTVAGAIFAKRPVRKTVIAKHLVTSVSMDFVRRPMWETEFQIQLPQVRGQTWLAMKGA
jgi:hypothetical protein